MTIRVLSAMLFTASLTAAYPALAQTQTGRFVKVENRDCQVWNPGPVPNETVYWTGICKDGLGEGRGIISYGTVVNGRPNVSISKVVLNGGRHTGYGEHYSRTGKVTRRIYENGRTRESVIFEYPSGENAKDQIKRDLESQPFINGLVDFVDVDVLDVLVEGAGFEVSTSAVVVDGVPVLDFKDDLGVKHIAMGAACRDEYCKGMILLGEYKAATAFNEADLTDFALNYPAISVYHSSDKPDTIKLARYLILDYGISEENLSVEVRTFVNLSKKMAQKFNAASSVK